MPTKAGVDGHIVFQPQDSPIVYFRSSATKTDESVINGPRRVEHVGHSLIQTAASTYDLPPLSCVTLEEIKPAGTWTAYHKHVDQPLLVVSVRYAVQKTKRAQRRFDKPTKEQMAAATRIQSRRRGQAARARLQQPPSA